MTSVKLEIKLTKNDNNSKKKKSGKIKMILQKLKYKQSKAQNRSFENNFFFFFVIIFYVCHIN